VLCTYFTLYHIPPQLGLTFIIAVAALAASAISGSSAALASVCILLFILQNDSALQKLSILRCFWLALFPVAAHAVIAYLSGSTIMAIVILCSFMYGVVSYPDDVPCPTKLRI
jgi:hypothetical protein